MHNVAIDIANNHNIVIVLTLYLYIFTRTWFQISRQGESPIFGR